MTETIEQEAGRRVREQVGKPGSHSPGSLHALALEQLITEHRATQAELEAFRREVSEAVEAIAKAWGTADPAWGYLRRFIIPQPDPLVEVMNAWWHADGYASIETFRAALAARGLEIVKKEPSQ